MINRTKEVETKVDNCLLEARACEVDLHNAFNKFMLLSCNQFVENVRSCAVDLKIVLRCHDHGVACV